MSRSQIILTNKNEMSFKGQPFQGDGYYGFSDGLHTVSFHVNNFTARVYLQATLLEEPTEDDWFDIELATTVPYCEFTQETGAKGITVVGNFVWIRVDVDRSYIPNQVYDISVHGSIDKAVLVI
jgi:hypothetical protein